MILHIKIFYINLIISLSIIIIAIPLLSTLTKNVDRQVDEYKKRGFLPKVENVGLNKRKQKLLANNSSQIQKDEFWSNGKM